MKVCVVGASGKLGRYMVRHALDRGYEVVGVCRAESVPKLADFEDRITVIPGRTNDPGRTCPGPAPSSLAPCGCSHGSCAATRVPAEPEDGGSS